MVRQSLLGLVFASAIVWPQSSAPPQQPPVFKTEANYVRVDVFPTKDGQPITDLTADDFEILEDRAPQVIDAFERVTIRGNLPEATRRDPNTLAESRAMVADAHARLFVLFLDINHVDIDGSRRIRQPLIGALDSIIGPDDLVGVMTPEMSARDITFARKATTIEGMLTRYWNWGERDRLNAADPIDETYRACYPGAGPLQVNVDDPRGIPLSRRACRDDDRGIADEMVERRKEKQTIDALSDLVRFLESARGGRKAILAITEGWRLFRPSVSLARELYCQVPQAADVGIDPRTGRITTKNTISQAAASCEKDRQMLANIDNQLEFREILERANRANASFYPIDPRGFVIFDTSLSAPRQGMPMAGVNNLLPSEDHARLTARLDSLRTLAEDTDGLAIVNSNDLSAGLRQVADDLSSYYLLGYYSTGKLDGKFHSISVRVKRPGVQVRARSGFRAATLAEVNSRTSGAAAPPREAADASAADLIDAALTPLAAFARELPLRVMAVSAWKPDRTPAIWVVAETRNRSDWTGGGEATLMLVDRSGATLATARGAIEPGVSSVRLPLAVPPTLAPGDYDLQLRIKPAGVGPATTDSTRVVVADAPRAIGAIFLRRGSTTGNRDVPTADLRFGRGDRLTVDMPVGPSSDQASARLLDRTGQPLPIPVAAVTRVDPDGTPWVSAQLSLVPLGIGDYLIEVAHGSDVTLFAFRVVP